MIYMTQVAIDGPAKMGLEQVLGVSAPSIPNVLPFIKLFLSGKESSMPVAERQLKVQQQLRFVFSMPAPNSIDMGDFPLLCRAGQFHSAQSLLEPLVGTADGPKLEVDLEEAGAMRFVNQEVRERG